MLIQFYIRFHTQYGQTLFISGNKTALGFDELDKAMPMRYLNDEFWYAELECTEDEQHAPLEYRYVLSDADGNTVVEWGNDRTEEPANINAKELVLIDTWNHAGDIENAFFTKPFKDVLLNRNFKSDKNKTPKTYSHEFKVKAPLLSPQECLCLIGSGKALGDWTTENPLLLSREGNWHTVKANLNNGGFPVTYKYGVYDTTTEAFVRFESGENRILPGDGGKGKITILHDGFARMPYPNWKGAGVAIPVFSLRSEKSFGTGEFADIPLLVDWANKTGLKLIQLLPINDTTATHSWTDTYPYAAVSAFALHPLFLNLEQLAGSKTDPIIKKLSNQQKELNALPAIDYEAVMKYKLEAIRSLFEQQKKGLQEDTRYFEFFDINRHWLVPYAAFCYLRDLYGTADYNQWPEYSIYDEDAIQALASPDAESYEGVLLHYFIQYHLHRQLKQAIAYAHQHGVVVKGDLPIGIYRYSCDAWVAPLLYNMDAQAGAPPDGFAVKGQNWGFPTYNWKAMQEEGFAWWRQRFEQMSEYFDAFRIDHILGFFRIWSIPLHAIEGIMGRFVPAIPVHINEFFQNNISFSHHRYSQPYITEQILNDRFGGQAEFVKQTFLDYYDNTFHFKPDFDTQRKVEAFFQQHYNNENPELKSGLFDLISNVIVFEEEGSQMQQYHFRFDMESTASFRDLDEYSKAKLKELYVNYFYRRQDDFWKKEAMNKLPELKRSTGMLVCGEDLGMVPDCVPDVMRQLGMLSLEIQRMPKQTSSTFFHPADAPYLSVVTPSTHDMSTIRGWWEEDAALTQQFYNQMLGHYGTAPYFCEPWINKEIILQHLYSPAMWCIFQLQDILGSSNSLRRNNPNEERINIPADPKHYWRYRMHLTLEQLLKENAFNENLYNDVRLSGR